MNSSACNLPSRLGRKPPTTEFWRLYASSLLIDLGLCLYFFLFTIFLIEHHFSEQSIGLITAALTVGAIAGMLLASLLATRFSLRTLMYAYVFVTPLCFAVRTFLLHLPAQLALAFLSGAATSIWSVCFSPTLAKFTNLQNRTFGFSLFVATGIGCGAVAGMIGGFLPGLLTRSLPPTSNLDGTRLVLLLACAILSLAALTIPRFSPAATEIHRPAVRVFNRFLVRFLIGVALWNFSLSFFTPFASVYLSRHAGLPVTRIGLIFTCSQLAQVVAVMAAPLLYRKVGLVTGIALTQLATAAMLWSLSRTSGSVSPLWILPLVMSLQWMSGPGLASLLMNRTPDHHRSQASAMHNIVNLATQAAAAAVAGRMFGIYGYAGPLAANAVVAAVAAGLLFLLLKNEGRVVHQDLPEPTSTCGLADHAASTCIETLEVQNALTADR